MQAKLLAAHASLILPAAGSIHSTEHGRLQHWKPSQPRHYKRRAVRKHCSAYKQGDTTCAEQDVPSCQWLHQVIDCFPRAVIILFFVLVMTLFTSVVVVRKPFQLPVA